MQRSRRAPMIASSCLFPPRLARARFHGDNALCYSVHLMATLQAWSNRPAEQVYARKTLTCALLQAIRQKRVDIGDITCALTDQKRDANVSNGHLVRRAAQRSEERRVGKEC